MEANADTWCTWDVLAKCYTPQDEIKVVTRNVESFRLFVTAIVLFQYEDRVYTQEMLDGVEWEKLLAYYIAENLY